MHALRAVLRSNPFLHRWRFLFYIAGYALAKRLTPVRPGRTLFLSDSRDGFSGNLAFLRDELVSQSPTADAIGVFKPRLSSRRPLLDALRLPWLMASAQSIVLDDYYPLIYPLRIRPDTRLIQVWHAAGAFKRVGWSRAGLPGGPLPGSPLHRNYTDVTVSSESVRGDYAEAFGVEIDRVHAIGVPRTDLFFDTDRVARIAADVHARYGIPRDKRIALFAPTFRGNGQLTATYDFDAVPWEKLVAELGDEWVLMVKMHPFVRSTHTAPLRTAGIVDASGERELNELLTAADVLVTDYSSSIFEYALLRRPIVLFCPDLHDYAATRDFYRPFDHYVAGPLVESGDELAKAIRGARVGAAAVRFRDEFVSACDGHSSARIVRELLLTPRRDAQGSKAPSA